MGNDDHRGLAVSGRFVTVSDSFGPPKQELQGLPYITSSRA